MVFVFLQSEKFKALQREERQKNEDRVKEAIEEMKEKQQVNQLVMRKPAFCICEKQRRR